MRRVAVGFLLFAGGALLVWSVWPARSRAPVWAATYDVTARPPETIPPGTFVEKGPPAGWSHLVLKTLPQIRPAERHRVNALTARMASWMFTVFLADVPPDEQARHHLRRVALGFGATVKGRDVVLTPDAAGEFGAKLDFIERSILSRGYEIQQLAMVVFQGPTMALVDTPVWFRCGSKNRLIRFRYALLVDRDTGRLDTLVWGLDPAQGGCLPAAASAVLLNADTVAVAELIPDMSEFNVFDIPSDSAFGVDRLPPGRATLPFAAGLLPLVQATRFTPEEARMLEQDLREMVAGIIPSHTPAASPR